MNFNRTFKRATLGTALAAVLAASVASGPSRAHAKSAAVKPTNDVALSVGTGRMIQLDGTMSDLFVANDGIADVQVRSTNQIYIFAKSPGETTVYATNRAGRTIYSANVRVGTNIGSIDEMIALAMPDAKIQATPMNGMVLLTGTVASPDDVEEAGRLVQAFIGAGTQVISRLKTATPLQVMLKVKIAEVSRSLIRNLGVNITSRDPRGGLDLPAGTIGRGGNVFDFANGTFVRNVGTSAAGIVFNAIGLQIAAQLEASENSGLTTTLAEPTLMALSGETASFLAGGEFPIPVASGLNGTSVQFKEYGVSLSFTPVVLEGGRISMRVRPEVSEIATDNGIKINGFDVPALNTRRTETTVELGSGQSLMLAGLMRNNNLNSIEKTPFLGDLPILGALFRSNGYRRNETELVIVVTPYLVKPASASEISLPTDGFRLSNDPQRILLDQREDGRSGERRPSPVSALPRVVAPAVGPVGSAVVPPAPTATPVKQASRASKPSAAPGFSF